MGQHGVIMSCALDDIKVPVSTFLVRAADAARCTPTLLVIVLVRARLPP